MPSQFSSPYLLAVLERKSGTLIFQGSVSIASRCISHPLPSIQSQVCLVSYLGALLVSYDETVSFTRAWFGRGACATGEKTPLITRLNLLLHIDIAMLSVPLYLIWSLQTSFRRKVGISAVFGTGALYVPRPP